MATQVMHYESEFLKNSGCQFSLVLNIFIYNELSAFLGERRKNVDLPNIFGTIKGIFRIESDRAD